MRSEMTRKRVRASLPLSSVPRAPLTGGDSPTSSPLSPTLPVGAGSGTVPESAEVSASIPVGRGGRRQNSVPEERAVERREGFLDDVSSIHDSIEELAGVQLAQATRAAWKRKRRRTDLVVEEEMEERFSNGDPDIEDFIDLRHPAEFFPVVEQPHDGYAKTGILTSIQLINFMSHSNFKLDLGPNVNIINGSNGSGKSAIVAALLVGLGIRTKERGEHISDHIKHGEKEARIIIHIANFPPEYHGEICDRYKPELYGDTIIIERRIVRPPDHAKSALTLKDQSGNTVSLPNKVTPSHEIAVILDHFNIMVDNPAALLTQNYCKQFLLQATPKRMHNLFMRATMFQFWEDHVHESCSQGDILRAYLAKAKRAIGEHHNNRDKLGKQLKAMQNLSKLQNKVKQLRALYAWVYVADLETDARASESRISELSKKIDHERSRIDDIAADIESISADIAEKQKKGESISDLLDTAAREDKTFEESRKGIQKRLRRANAEVKHLQLQKRDGESQLASLRGAGDAARAKYDDMKLGSKSFSRDTQVLQQRLNEMLAQGATLDVSEKATRAAIEELESKHGGLAEALQRLHGEVSQSQNDLLTLRRSKTNQLRKWGTGVFNSCLVVEKHYAKFKERPIGPLGAYLRVKDKNWTKAVQTCFGSGLLSTFLVDNGGDEQLLRQLCGNQVSMICTSLTRERYNVGSSCRRTILDEIEVRHPAVFNALVDHADADCQILLSSGDEFESIAYGGEKGIVACWNTNGDRAYCRYGSRVFRAGPKYIKPLLTTDLEEEITLKDCALAKLDERSKAAELSLMVVSGQLQSKKQHYDLIQREITETNALKSRLATQLREAEIRLDVDDQEAFDGSSWEEEIATSQKELELVEGCLAEKLISVQQDKTDLDALVAQHRKTINDRASTVALREEMTSNTRESWNQLTHAGSEKSKCEKLLECLNGELVAARKELNDKFSEIELQRAAALAISPTRLVSSRTLMDIQDEMERFEHRIENEKRRHQGLGLEDVERDFLAAKALLIDLREQEDRVVKLEKMVNAAHPDRIRRYQSVLKSTKRTANLQFGRYLAKRGNTGELIFDPELESLSVTVSMATSDLSGRTTNELGSLSGGERSYATLSFLMAMGESMEIPFRVMDEFDVFMDEANRAAALRMLVDMATEVPHRQFIFLTPNQLPDLSPAAAAKVKVFRLADPRAA